MIPQHFFAEENFYTEFYDYLEYLYACGYDEPIEGVMDEPEDVTYELWEAQREPFTVFTPENMGDIIENWCENQEERLSEDGEEPVKIAALFEHFITDKMLKPINDKIPQLYYETGRKILVTKQEAIDYLNHK